jgi:2-keto-4-pentenoate hydratase
VGLGQNRVVTVRLSPAVEAALRAQLEVRRGVLAHGADAVGWKIAASIPGVEEGAGAGGLVFGFLTTATLMPAGGRFSAGITVNLCGEVELGVMIGRDVAADADLETAAASVDAVGVALEIVDVYQAGAMHEVVASNVFHRAVAFGPTRRDANPKSVTARLKTDGQTVSTKTVEVDPARTVWTMARLVGAVDQQLRAGDWILGGSLIHLPIAADHEVTAVLDGFGEVSLKVDS